RTTRNAIRYPRQFLTCGLRGATGVAPRTFFPFRLLRFLKSQSDYLCRIFHQRNLPNFFLRKPACVVGIPARMKFASKPPAQKIYYYVVIENSPRLIAQ